MPLEFQTIVIPFGQGLEERFADSKVPAEKLVVAENGVIDKLGSVDVRPGFQDMDTDVYDAGGGATTTLQPITRVLGHHDETIVIADKLLHTYSETAVQWVEKDHAYEGTVKARVLGEKGQDAVQANGDVVYCGGYYAHVWRDYVSGEIKVRFTDAVTGARFPPIVVSDPRSVTGAAFRVVAAGTRVHVFYVDASTNELKAATYLTAAIETAATTTVIGTNVDTAEWIDAYSTTTGSTIRIFVAWYQDNGATHAICANQWTDALVQVGVTLAHVTQNSAPIAITGKINYHVYVAWTPPTAYADDSLRVLRIVQSTWALALPSTAVDNDVYGVGGNEVRACGIVSTSTAAIVVYEIRKSAGSARVPELRARWVTSAGALGDGMVTRRIGMLSKPIIYDGEPYVVGYYHEKSHVHITNHEAPGYPNRYGYLLHVRTGTTYEIGEQ